MTRFWIALPLVCLGLLPPSGTADVLDLVQAASADPKTPTAAGDGRPVADVPEFGAAGSVFWSLGVTAGAEFRVTNLACIRGAIDWFVATDFSIGLQGDLGWAGSAGHDGGVLVGLAPILRWHFLRRDRWTLFAELGVGAAWTTVEIPESGTRFNFTPQAGVGATWAVDDDWRLRVALGWYHMSNARTGRSNPGLDAVAVTIGVGRSF